MEQVMISGPEETGHVPVTAAAIPGLTLSQTSKQAIFLGRTSQCIHSVKLQSSGEKVGELGIDRRPSAPQGTGERARARAPRAEFPQEMFSLAGGEERAAKAECRKNTPRQ